MASTRIVPSGVEYLKWLAATSPQRCWSSPAKVHCAGAVIDRNGRLQRAVPVTTEMWEQNETISVIPVNAYSFYSQGQTEPIRVTHIACNIWRNQFAVNLRHYMQLLLSRAIYNICYLYIVDVIIVTFMAYVLYSRWNIMMEHNRQWVVSPMLSIRYWSRDSLGCWAQYSVIYHPTSILDFGEQHIVGLPFGWVTLNVGVCAAATFCFIILITRVISIRFRIRM